jgi:glycosyltransferase involved in cell wall biosynthesis
MRIADTLNKIKPYVDEMIVVDDASSDDTAEVARKHGAKVISQTTNKGYIETIKRGFGEARGASLSPWMQMVNFHHTTYPS